MIESNEIKNLLGNRRTNVLPCMALVRAWAARGLAGGLAPDSRRRVLSDG